MKLLFKWHDYRYFPYERRFASEEIEVLFGYKPLKTPNGLLLNFRTISKQWEKLAMRTTYFSKVVINDTDEIVPHQAVLESSVNGFRTMCTREAKYKKLATLSRQSTRYSAHGLHDYKGKFNPQVVRAIGNLLALKPGAWVLDPFCGSGTTLVEARHIGWNAIGLDVNPLAVAITNAKLAALNAKLKDLVSATLWLTSRLTKNANGIRVLKSNRQRKLANYDYLKCWFTPEILTEINTINTEISSIRNREMRSVFRIILSDILRDVSLQDPADLRIRRRPSPPMDISAVSRFVDSLEKEIRLISNARRYLYSSTAKQVALLGDAKTVSRSNLAKTLSASIPCFDAAITSPPYATALPYIDTQRLSLAALNLVRPQDMHSTEKRLIGTREISAKDRSLFEKEIRLNPARLPAMCIDVCHQLLQRASDGSDGFRRKNVPALVYKYLKEMSAAFYSIRPLLRPKSPFVLIVGRNRTTLASEEIIIDTPRLLAGIAEIAGFSVEQVRELDTYRRFDLHSSNSIRSEAMLVLKRN